MVFPSIQNLVKDVKYVIARFPLEIAFAIIGTIAAIVSIENVAIDGIVSNWCTRIIMTANLGLLISLSVSLYLESKAVKGPQLYLYKVFIALLVSCMVFILNPLQQGGDYIRFFLLSLAGHLLVSFSAYIHADSIQGFWQFNKTIFIRFLTGVLDSAVLYLGLAAAIGATKFLFNIDLGSNAYSILFVLIAGLFNTTFFLAGIPKDLDALNKDFTYPKALKIFTQYVLIPLATIYVIILLAYEVKILIQWNLPKGLVSNLILGYAVFGILAILLIFPIREQEENTWIKTYARSFYFLMLPLIVLLFLAVGTRVFRYGITENRYFLIMLAIWLLMVTVYSLISRKQNIRLIPVSLCLFTLFCVYGPQSAFSISKYSQTKILTDIFKRNNAFKDHKMIKPKKISEKDGVRAARTLRFIVENYDYSALQAYVIPDLKLVEDSLAHTKEIEKSNQYSRSYDLKNLKLEWLQNHVGLKGFSNSRFDYPPAQADTDDSYFIRDDDTGLIAVKGYDYILQESDFEQKKGKNMPFKVRISEKKKNSGVISLHLNNDSTEFDLKVLLTTILKNPEQLRSFKNTGNISADYEYSLPADMLSISKETKNFMIVYRLSAIRFNRVKNKDIREFGYNNGVFLIKIK
jgi:hypothetical protein